MARARKTTPALSLVTEITAEPSRQAETKASATDATDVRALALTHGPAAIEALVKIMNGDGSEPSRIAAANALLDRAYGKARQGPVVVETPEGGEETKLTVMFV